MPSLQIDKLINEISKLPGLGRRSAQRIALHLLKNRELTLLPLVNSLQEANNKIINCDICGNIDTINPCSLCTNEKRDSQTICVIEDVSDLWTFERIGFFRGMYHILGGSLSAINGIASDDLFLSKLLGRIENQKVKEVILALSTTMEGQTTSHVISDKLEKFSNLKITKLAQGVPIGGEVHYLDENTLHEAFQSRKQVN
ncbi:MAG: Recombination protein RecR [Alphaproteobacteria bacterium MarineAlpha5_Bin8]|nr:MAG: Recombination protein RecR [Alphaproteobacteria bacterium MarineAlpha5_Bin8]PPR54357.1 MAG: Recombination protein RecR [Alphaproteobacteria bacterium MarineAlpha5_Bin6]|tara:strand:+ start:441 stop:1040 length:600 start_codon:yes stop_codon:yes gene_type:complete